MKERLNIALEADLKRWLEDYAKAEKRSMNAQLEKILEEVRARGGLAIAEKVA